MQADILFLDSYIEPSFRIIPTSMTDTPFSKRSNRSSTFTEWLREQNQENWDAAVHHRFVDELFAGSVADDVMKHYLVQDYQFIDRFVALLGAAIASADLYTSRVRFSRFAAMITSDENTYFLRAFDELGLSEKHRITPPLTEPTTAFQALMTEAADSRLYPMCLSVLVVAAWLYLSWAERPAATLPERFIHAEWITLHNNAAFVQFIGWLRSELDRTGPLLTEQDQAHCTDMFGRAVALERAFFDHVYTPLIYS